MKTIRKVAFLFLGLLGLAFLSIPTITLNAEESVSTDVSESDFEQKTYVYEEENNICEITLLNEDECSVLLTYDGETIEGITTYSLEDNVLTLYNPDESGTPQTISFELNSDGTLTPLLEENETEDSEENIVFEDLILELEGKIEYYKSLLENETFRTVIEAIITFLVILIARLIENKSFKKATNSLISSNQQNAIVKAAMEQKQKEDLAAIEALKSDVVNYINEAIETIKSENVNSKDIAKIVNVGFKTVNAAILKLLQDSQTLTNKIIELSKEIELLKTPKGVDNDEEDSII